MRVSKRGKDLAVRIPAAVVRELNLKEGDEVDLRRLAGNEFVVVCSVTRGEAVEAISRGDTRLPRVRRRSR